MRSPGQLGFRARLTLRWTVAFSGILVAASGLIYTGIHAATYEGLDRNLRTLAATEVAAATDEPDSPPHIHELPDWAGGTFAEKLVQVYDDRGTLILWSSGRAASGPLISPSDVKAAVAGEVPLRTVRIGDVPVRVVVLRATAAGRVYAIAVGVVITEILASLQRVAWLLAMVWAFSTAVTAGVGFALASTALRPVRRITERALEIARTDLRARLEPQHVSDEIGLMTEAVNLLLDRLHAALDANRRFAADAAHELRSPLTAMKGEIEVALRRERTASEYRDVLIRVEERLTVLSTLIADLMLLVRAQENRTSVPMTEVPIEALLRGSVARLEPLARSRGVRVELASAAGLLAYGDPGLLARVFDNVLENAIRYNREHGLVWIGTSYRDPPQGSAEPGTVTVEIADTGIGVPESERERVFARFHRVDGSRSRHTGGAGLGLAIAREVLALFRGTIRIVESSPAGTKIEVVLPGGCGPSAGIDWAAEAVQDTSDFSRAGRRPAPKPEGELDDGRVDVHAEP